MKDETREWLQKAHSDLRMAKLGFGLAPDPEYDDSCFHSQQCVEKLIKAVLVERGISFPHSHDIGGLVDRVATVEPSLASLRDELDALSSLAVIYRYPGDRADADDAQTALALAVKAHELVMCLLQPPAGA